MVLPKVFGPPRPIARRQLADATAQSGRDVGLSIRNQEQTYWCWAAVTEAVWRLLDRDHARTQCQIATDNLPRPPAGGCCGTTRGGPCDSTSRLDYALSRAGCLNGNRQPPLSFEQLREEIDKGLPVAIHIEWPDGSGHYIAATNWMTHSGGRQAVRISDPDGPNVDEVPFAALESAYTSRRGSWSTSYLTKRGAAPAAGERPRGGGRHPRGD